MTKSQQVKDKNRRPQMCDFIAFVNQQHHLTLPQDYAQLWQWSVDNPAVFWQTIWNYFEVIGTLGSGKITNPTKMPGAKFFEDAQLNICENLLRDADSRPAIIARNENPKSRTIISRAELLAQTKQLAGWFLANGVGEGDSVAAYMPNIPETVIAFLATSSIGASFSSCSMDFGSESVCERFSQTQPKILITANGYVYGGKVHERHSQIAQIVEQLPSVQKILQVDYLESINESVNESASALTELSKSKTIAWQDINQVAPLQSFSPYPFNTPLLSLFSSGTTGAPKCIVHGSGGVLLQHLKEHALHTDIRAGDVVFYFTTCGWMMWNWLISALALRATIVLYEGNPLYPSPSVLWDMAAEEGISMFGTSAKYIDALRLANIAPRKTHQLPKLRTIASTGSPLSPEGFDFVYDAISADVHLASISGGTDIVSCFALGNPMAAVRRGELQCRGLGMNVRVFDEAGAAVLDTAGELVCISPFPTMPLGFRNDADGKKYRAAYFADYANVWRHGDWASLSADGMMKIYGRSDATLNPGGVRIGTAEIYRTVKKFHEIEEAIAVGQQFNNDTRIILFIVLVEGAKEFSDDDLIRLKKDLSVAIRSESSPRHVPSKIIVVDDIPRTRSGKISEIAVREVIHGRSVKNENALANPESLLCFQDLVELES